MGIDKLLEIVENICKIGKGKRDRHYIYDVGPFQHFFNESEKGKQIIYDQLDTKDGKFTRREILARYLLLSSVLDQGPDIKGVELLLNNVISELYKKEIRILHRPLDFFKKLNILINTILEEHEKVKNIRAEIWAKENNTRSSKYNLFFAQSQRGIISIKQVLDYSVHRWGVPLCALMLLEKDCNCSAQPFINYIENFDSAEKFTKKLKNHEKYGLGSAIGDKACHLFAKNYVSILNLRSTKVKNDKRWSDISYELPLDSNAGRVLFRVGFVKMLLEDDVLIRNNVIQKRKGKGETNYIRITNLRDIKIENCDLEKYKSCYSRMVKEHLIIGSKEIIYFQRVPNLLIYLLSECRKISYSIADFDDGLIYIGTNFCFNHSEPKCDECDIKGICAGKGTSIIKDYTT